MLITCDRRFRVMFADIVANELRDSFVGMIERDDPHNPVEDRILDKVVESLLDKDLYEQARRLARPALDDRGGRL